MRIASHERTTSCWFVVALTIAAARAEGQTGPLKDDVVVAGTTDASKRLTIPVSLRSSPGGASVNFTMVVDTGASKTMVPKSVLDQLGVNLSSWTKQAFSSVNSKFDSLVGPVHELIVGTVKREKFEIGVMPEEGARPGGAASKPADAVGLLGTDFLQHYDFVIDQEFSKLHLLAIRSEDEMWKIVFFWDKDSDLEIPDAGGWREGESKLEKALIKHNPDIIESATFFRTKSDHERSPFAELIASLVNGASRKTGNSLWSRGYRWEFDVDARPFSKVVAPEYGRFTAELLGGGGDSAPLVITPRSGANPSIVDGVFRQPWRVVVNGAPRIQDALSTPGSGHGVAVELLSSTGQPENHKVVVSARPGATMLRMVHVNHLRLRLKNQAFRTKVPGILEKVVTGGGAQDRGTLWADSMRQPIMLLPYSAAMELGGAASETYIIETAKGSGPFFYAVTSDLIPNADKGFSLPPQPGLPQPWKKCVKLSPQTYVEILQERGAPPIAPDMLDKLDFWELRVQRPKAYVILGRRGESYDVRTCALNGADYAARQIAIGVDVSTTWAASQLGEIPK